MQEVVKIVEWELSRRRFSDANSICLLMLKDWKQVSRLICCMFLNLV